MSEGIDVSKWQGTVDWKKVYGAGKRFAMARASIASSTIDETFATNYKGMLAAGLVPGAYHLVSGASSGIQQAINFGGQLAAANFDRGLLVLDVEGWEETLNGNEIGTLLAVEYLCDWIRETYKRTPIIYTGVYWRDDLVQHPNNFGAELWLSYYGTNDPDLYVPRAWTTKGWKILQYSSTGSVAGVSGNCDLNRNAGTLKSLKELAGWEWDELATQAEIRTIVNEEVAKAIAALRESEIRLSQDITTSHTALHTALATSQEDAIAKLDEVKAALSQLGTVIGSATGADEILAEIDTLHRHVCRRADYHMNEES